MSEFTFNFACDEKDYFLNSFGDFTFFPQSNEKNLDLFIPDINNDFYFKTYSDLKKKVTNSKTKKNECYNEANINSPSPSPSPISESINDEPLFNFYSFEKIKEIFSKNEKFFHINYKFQKNEDIKEAEDKLCKRKRRRYAYLNIKNSVNKIEERKEEEENKIKRGRKTKDTIYHKEHNKMSSDNIIKKIKAKLFIYLLQFLNNMIKKSDDDKNRLYKLDYRFIDQLNKNIDIKYLKMTLKDLFSLDISSKYKNFSPDENQQLIQNIISHKEYVEDYDTVIFVFNMTFGEWLDLFTCKKDINDLKNQYKQNNNINFEKIGNNIVYVDNLLKNLWNENIQKKDEKYFSFFIFYIYNYEKWFSIKSSRRRKRKNN